jgi:hypothetical protein
MEAASRRRQVDLCTRSKGIEGLLLALNAARRVAEAALSGVLDRIWAETDWFRDELACKMKLTFCPRLGMNCC